MNRETFTTFPAVLRALGYDAFGRIIDGTLPDGTVRAALGKSAKGLVDVSSGIGTPANPAPVTRFDDVDGDYVDGRGNPSNQVLDPQGRATLEMDELGRITTHTREQKRGRS